MRRLPSEEELRDTADEVSKQLQTLSTHDFDKVIASLDVAIWECERDMLLNLDSNKPDAAHVDFRSYFSGGLFHLRRLREGLQLARDAKARQG